MTYENEIFKERQYEFDTIQDCIFIDCTFEKCIVSDMKFVHCSFKGCHFINCSAMNLEFKYTQAGNNEFENCMLMGINWTELLIDRAIFLPFSVFSDCTLKYNGFYGLNLKQFHFNTNNIIGSFFEECNIEKGQFRYCNLKDTSFSNNNLKGADFRDAKDYVISIETNQIKKAKFSYPEVLNLLKTLDILIE